MKYKTVVSMLSDVGCHREVNEDSYLQVQPEDAKLLKKRGALFVVADGMGGHSAGEIASRMAVDILNREYYALPGDAQAALTAALCQANREIYEAALKNEEMRGMGTTCTALVLQDDAALSAHVGDSRLYLIRGNQIHLMTEDHSYVMELVKKGVLSSQDARRHPDKNIILRAVGSHSEVEVSTWQEPFPVHGGDTFLLCSDGLYDLVEDEEIRKAVIRDEPRQASENLVELAKERGGHDNITVGIVKVKPQNKTGYIKTRQTRDTEARK